MYVYLLVIWAPSDNFFFVTILIIFFICFKKLLAVAVN